MKKYMKPETMVAHIQPATMIAQSPGGVGNGDTVGKKYNSSDVTYSRGRSGWDDDDE